MKSQSNDGGGTTWILTEGDSLASVPEDFMEAITPEIRAAFENPQAYFLALAEQLSCRSLSRWIRDLIADGGWRLMVADTYMMEREVLAGFRWSCPTNTGVILQPGSGSDDPQSIFHQLRWIHWYQVAWSGGLYRPGHRPTLKRYGMETSILGYAPEDCEVCGNTSDGDVFVLTPDDNGAFLSHENLKSYRLGNEAEMWEWVFEELRNRREPEFDYSRV